MSMGAATATAAAVAKFEHYLFARQDAEERARQPAAQQAAQQAEAERSDIGRT
jgi:hypothetical protein